MSLVQLQRQYPAIRIIDFARNFGKEAALTAGLDYASGAAVIPIDADMQDPPEVIKEFIAKWREGYEVVYGTRRTRESDTEVKRTTAHQFYKWYNKVSEVPIPENTGDFRLMDRKVVEALKTLPERNRFMKGLFAWAGFKQTAVMYDRAPRATGVSKWNYWQLWNFAIDGITSFSTFPIACVELPWCARVARSLWLCGLVDDTDHIAGGGCAGLCLPHGGVAPAEWVADDHARDHGRVCWSYLRGDQATASISYP